MGKEYINLKNLEVYKLSRQLSMKAWDIYKELDWHNQKIIGDQFIESGDSVGANIAEGYRRYHYLDKIKFYYNARASLSESCEHWLPLLYERAFINEDTFKKVYPNDDLKTEADFKVRVQKDLEEHYAKDSDRQFTSEVIAALIEKSNLDLPDEFLKRWLLDSNQGKITAEQLDVQYDSYAKTFKWQLIEDKLRDQFGDALKVDDEAVRDKVRAYFQVQGKDNSNPQIEQIVDQILSKEEEGRKIYSELMDEKLGNVFKENVKRKEETVTPDKFMEIMQNINK
jgi:four helix bundle protein